MLSNMGGFRPSSWEEPISLLFRVRGEARRAKARGPKGREWELGSWGKPLKPSPCPPDIEGLGE